jgi:ABC-type antimicrobial peptide transport system permease subunit
MHIPAAQVDPRFLAILHVWVQPSWIVRTAAPVEGLTAQRQRALASVDPNLPFSGFYSMSALQSKSRAMQRLEVALLGVMAALALLLSAVGIFALVTNLVAEKTREIAIPTALGSNIREAMINIGAPGARASALGFALGLLGAAGLRAMSTVLYGVAIYDVPTIRFVILILGTITFIAATVPTLRTARIDPARTWREE